MHIPEDRTTLILRVQSPYLRLLEINQEHESDFEVKNATKYGIEKLAVALSYLLSPDNEIEKANYEVGLAARDLTRMAGTVTSSVSKQLKELAEELDMIFTELPADPWPINGFGAPGVESRFG